MPWAQSSVLIEPRAKCCLVSVPVRGAGQLDRDGYRALEGIQHALPLARPVCGCSAGLGVPSGCWCWCRYRDQNASLPVATVQLGLSRVSIFDEAAPVPGLTQSSRHDFKQIGSVLTRRFRTGCGFLDTPIHYVLPRLQMRAPVQKTACCGKASLPAHSWSLGEPLEEMIWNPTIVAGSRSYRLTKL